MQQVRNRPGSHDRTRVLLGRCADCVFQGSNRALVFDSLVASAPRRIDGTARILTMPRRSPRIARRCVSSHSNPAGRAVAVARGLARDSNYGTAAVGYLVLEGDGGVSDAGDAILEGETPDPNTYGSGDPLEDAETTGTTPAGLTATREELESVLENLRTTDYNEIPTSGAGGHLL